jgi:hypothetical protein
MVNNLDGSPGLSLDQIALIRLLVLYSLDYLAIYIEQTGYPCARLTLTEEVSRDSTVSRAQLSFPLGSAPYVA